MPRVPKTIPTGWIPGQSSHLAVYLNDHLAGATAGVELARRAARSNKGSELGEFLSGLAAEIEEDRDSLRALMRSLDVGADRAKVAAGWTAEKLGRFKLNGQLLGYSPLSRLVELEGLALGVRGKLAMWEGLRAAGVNPGNGAGVDLDDLASRAQAQSAGLENWRVQVAREVLG